jgi:pimeloyl-ACP methyl ester carboxylesterase
MLSTRLRITHSDKDVSAPIDLIGRPTAALIPNADLKVYEGAPHCLLLGAHEVVELDGAKLFFPWERSVELAAALRNFWD